MLLNNNAISNWLDGIVDQVSVMTMICQFGYIKEVARGDVAMRVCDCMVEPTPKRAHVHVPTHTCGISWPSHLPKARKGVRCVAHRFGVEKKAVFLGKDGKLYSIGLEAIWLLFVQGVRQDGQGVIKQSWKCGRAGVVQNAAPLSCGLFVTEATIQSVTQERLVALSWPCRNILAPPLRVMVLGKKEFGRVSQVRTHEHVDD